MEWHAECSSLCVSEKINSGTLLTTCCMTLLLSVCSYSQVRPDPNGSRVNFVLEQMRKAQLEAPAVAYQVTRDYRLFGGNDSAPSSEVVAEVDYSPSEGKSYEIQKKSGSKRGEDVVHKVLQHEVEMAQNKNSAQSAIDLSNYSFDYLGETNLDGNDCYLLALNPRRNDNELLQGRAWVDQKSFQIRRIQGQMVKNPSWFLKRVNVTIDFSELGGSWLQTRVEAVADVRLIGSQTLRSETLDAHVGEPLLAKNSRSNENVSRGRGQRHAAIPATAIVSVDGTH